MRQRIQTFLLFLLCPYLFTLIVWGDNIELDETRVSVIGWTDAHTAVYGWPIIERVIIPLDDIVDFVKYASDDFLCRQNDFGQTVLHLAVRQNNLGVLQLCVDRRLECLETGNNDGDTPLHYAAFWNRPEAAKLLLPLTTRNKQILNKEGESPLDDAKKHSHPAMIRLLKDDATSSSNIEEL